MLPNWNLIPTAPGAAILPRLFAVIAAFWLAIGLVHGAAAATQDDDVRRLMRLGPGDSVSIEVYGQPDMNTTVYVGDNGNINVPLVGPVHVDGLSPVEAAAKTEKALSDGGYFVDPHVNINIVQSRSQRVSILGEVRQPGRYPIEPNTSIFELLAQAGGVTDNGGDTVYVTRRDAHGDATQFEISLKGQLPASANRDPSRALQAGDEILVPKVDRFYIYGEVAAPGMFRLEHGMTVIQAIARAGGITPRGSERRVEIKRKGKDGKLAVLHSKPSDTVEADDVIRIKESIF